MITTLSKEEFVAAAWDVVGRKVSKERLLLDIYDIATVSVGLPVAEGSDAIDMFRMVLAEGRSLFRQRRIIERRAAALLSDNLEYQLLRTITGIGPINALTILAEAGDLRRFRHHRQSLKVNGMDLATNQSGVFRGHTKLSKYGNARLRRTFWMAAQVAAMQKMNSFRDKFERYIAQDRHNPHVRRKVYTGVAAKIARTAHAIIKSGEPYSLFFEGSALAEGPLSSRAVGA